MEKYDVDGRLFIGEFSSLIKPGNGRRPDKNKFLIPSSTFNVPC